MIWQIELFQHLVPPSVYIWPCFITLVYKIEVWDIVLLVGANLEQMSILWPAVTPFIDENHEKKISIFRNVSRHTGTFFVLHVNFYIKLSHFTFAFKVQTNFQHKENWFSSRFCVPPSKIVLHSSKFYIRKGVYVRILLYQRLSSGGDKPNRIHIRALDIWSDHFSTGDRSLYRLFIIFSNINGLFIDIELPVSLA